MDYKSKYLKYKSKYINLQKQLGGTSPVVNTIDCNIINKIENALKSEPTPSQKQEINRLERVKEKALKELKNLQSRNEQTRNEQARNSRANPTGPGGLEYTTYLGSPLQNLSHI